MTEEKNYYEILGVSETADENEIRVRYRALSKKYHPDQNVGLSETEIEEREKIFKEASEAYAVLSDEIKRKEYDLNLKLKKLKGMNNTYTYNYSYSYDFSNDDLYSAAAKAYEERSEKIKEVLRDELVSYRLLTKIMIDISKLGLMVPAISITSYFTVKNVIDYIQIHQEKDLAFAVFLAYLLKESLVYFIKNLKKLPKDVKEYNSFEEKRTKIF